MRDSCSKSLYVRAEGAGGKLEEAVLDRRHPSFEWTIGSISSRGVWSFFGLGVEHILIGFDHLLFLLVALLGCRTWRSIVAVVSLFTW